MSLASAVSASVFTTFCSTGRLPGQSRLRITFSAPTVSVRNGTSLASTSWVSIVVAMSGMSSAWSASDGTRIVSPESWW